MRLIKWDIKPILIWMCVVMIELSIMAFIVSYRQEFYRCVINEIFEYGMIDEFQRMSLIQKWL